MRTHRSSGEGAVRARRGLADGRTLRAGAPLAAPGERGEGPSVPAPAVERAEQGGVPPARSAGPVQWWQWLLVYPAVIVALVTAVPMYLGKVRDSERSVQDRMWAANAACTAKATFQVTRTASGAVIGSVICRSGDVLVYGKLPGWNHAVYRWVPFSTIAVDDDPIAWRGLLVPSARAGEVPSAVAQGSIEILCQRPLGVGRLLQRIRTDAGCFDQVIDTRTGRVLSSKQVPCSDRCEGAG